MIKNLPEEAKKELPKIFNESWRRGLVPGCWKKAVIVPIPKDGKDPGKRESYRPVSLTPILVKILDRMVVMDS
jgi:hypothetical protein